MLETPVVLFIFNRPHTTTRVIDALRPVRPRRVFVVADGPRNAAEAELCDATRAVLERMDWPCEIVADFAAHNLGCGRRVSSGLAWVFSQVENAIILEDDCVPAASFFPYCAELLGRYRDDEQVMMIGGYNPIAIGGRQRPSYHFSRYGSHWGWATWRRAWRHYDYEMGAWDEADGRQRLRLAVGAGEYWDYLSAIWQKVRAGQIDTWDCQWTFSQLLRGGLAAVPSVNLISNIGFGTDATHTRQGVALAAQASVHELAFPLQHPATLTADEEFDRLLTAWRLGRPDAALVLARAEEHLAMGRHAKAFLLLRAMQAAGLPASEEQQASAEALTARALSALRPGAQSA